MENNLSALQALGDLWFIIVKLLGRPVVQLQLAAGLGTLLLAWLPARRLTRLLQRRWQRRRQAGAGTDAGIDASADARPGPWYWFGQLLALPVIALTLAAAVNLLFVQQGWTNGLLGDLITLLGFFLLYRCTIGLLYIFLDPALVARHRRRFLAPLFAVLVVLLVLSRPADLGVLAQATVFPWQEGVLTLGALLLATVGLYFWFMAVALGKDITFVLLSRRQDDGADAVNVEEANVGALNVGALNAGALNAGLTLVQYGLLALGLFGAFRLLQLDPAMVAAITGGLSIGVGFALQDVLKNFIGGLIVLFEGSIRPGDWVQIAATEGEIDKLSIRSTIVRTFDDVEYIVPNQDWLSATVTTYTRNSRRGRARVPIGVSYDANPRFVQQLLVDTAGQHPDVLADPPPAAALVEFGASSVNFVVLAWVADAKFRNKVAGELRLMIWDAFAEHGIEIPYPQQDLHIRSGRAEDVTVSPEPA